MKIEQWIKANQQNRTPGMIRQINRTGFKTLDRLAMDPRIATPKSQHVIGDEDIIWNEGENGFWALLAEDLNWFGCSCIHEWTIPDLFKALEAVEVGPTY